MPSSGNIDMDLQCNAASPTVTAGSVLHCLRSYTYRDVHFSLPFLQRSVQVRSVQVLLLLVVRGTRGVKPWLHKLDMFQQ